MKNETAYSKEDSYLREYIPSMSDDSCNKVLTDHGIDIKRKKSPPTDAQLKRQRIDVHYDERNKFVLTSLKEEKVNDTRSSIVYQNKHNFQENTCVRSNYQSSQNKSEQYNVDICKNSSKRNIASGSYERGDSVNSRFRDGRYLDCSGVGSCENSVEVRTGSREFTMDCKYRDEESGKKFYTVHDGEKKKDEKVKASPAGYNTIDIKSNMIPTGSHLKYLERVSAADIPMNANVVQMSSNAIVISSIASVAQFNPGIASKVNVSPVPSKAGGISSIPKIVQINSNAVHNTTNASVVQLPANVKIVQLPPSSANPTNIACGHFTVAPKPTTTVSRMSADALASSLNKVVQYPGNLVARNPSYNNIVMPTNSDVVRLPLNSSRNISKPNIVRIPSNCIRLPINANIVRVPSNLIGNPTNTNIIHIPANVVRNPTNINIVRSPSNAAIGSLSNPNIVQFSDKAIGKQAQPNMLHLPAIPVSHSSNLNMVPWSSNAVRSPLSAHIVRLPVTIPSNSNGFHLPAKIVHSAQNLNANASHNVIHNPADVKIVHLSPNATHNPTMMKVVRMPLNVLHNPYSVVPLPNGVAASPQIRMTRFISSGTVPVIRQNTPVLLRCRTVPNVLRYCPSQNVPRVQGPASLLGRHSILYGTRDIGSSERTVDAKSKNREKIVNHSNLGHSEFKKPVELEKSMKCSESFVEISENKFFMNDSKHSWYDEECNLLIIKLHQMLARLRCFHKQNDIKESLKLIEDMKETRNDYLSVKVIKRKQYIEKLESQGDIELLCDMILASLVDEVVATIKQERSSKDNESDPSYAVVVNNILNDIECGCDGVYLCSVGMSEDEGSKGTNHIDVEVVLEVLENSPQSSSVGNASADRLVDESEEMEEN